MYERHGEEEIPSSRYRDLVDLLLIALREDIDGAELQQALRCEANRRRVRGVNISLPATFEVPHAATWKAGYSAQAKGVSGLEQHQDLDAAVDLATRFVGPLLREHPPGTWDPARRQWI